VVAMQKRWKGSDSNPSTLAGMVSAGEAGE